jgi:hypothetical protein
MPEYRVTYFYVDDRDGTTNKSFTGEFANDADANLAAENFRQDLETCTVAGIYRMELTEITEYPASVPVAGSSVFDRVVATVLLNDTQKKASVEFPAPAAAILTGNALNKTATAWTNLMANLNDENWEISDGEYVSGTVSGKFVVRASGKSNLPS